MKFRNLLLATLLIFCNLFCFGQDIPIPGSNLLEPKPTVQFNISSARPYYVLKADGKTAGVSMLLDTAFRLNAIDPSSIEKLEVLKGENATSQYGQLGINGVIVITFKNYATLPKELKDMFKDTE